jgi:DNA invertase Pin-like site-specific DNA recombinase
LAARHESHGDIGPFTHQEDRAREYIGRKGWAVAEDHVYTDDGISGAEFSKRPDLVRLLRDVEQKPRPPLPRARDGR